MRKIFLTESELVKLVKKILKEDEMMGEGFSVRSLYDKSPYTAKLPMRLTITSITGEVKFDGITKRVGEINTSSRITCTGDCEIIFKNVVGLGKISVQVVNKKPKIFVTTD